MGRGGRRGILYHRLWSAEAEDFESEPTEIRTALGTVGAALAGKTVTYLLDSQFDDVAVWSTIWAQHQHLVCRLQHAERLVEVPDGNGGWRPGTIAEAQHQARELARARTELLVRKRGRRYLKRQPCTARIAACPVRVSTRPTCAGGGPAPSAPKRPGWWWCGSRTSTGSPGCC